MTLAFSDGIKTDEVNAVVDLFKDLVASGEVIVATAGVERTVRGAQHLHVAFVGSCCQRNRHYNEKVKKLFPPERLQFHGGRRDRNIYSRQPSLPTNAATWLAYPLKEGFIDIEHIAVDNSTTRWYISPHPLTIEDEAELALGAEFHLRKKQHATDKEYRITLATAPSVIGDFRLLFDTDSPVDEPILDTLVRMFFCANPTYNFKSFFPAKKFDDLMRARLHVAANLLSQDQYEDRVREALAERCGITNSASSATSAAPASAAPPTHAPKRPRASASQDGAECQRRPAKRNRPGVVPTAVAYADAWTNT